MAEVTITEISYTEIPMTFASGTLKRRALVYVRCTSAGTGDTLNLSTYIPNIADIEGISYETLDGADDISSSNTWVGPLLTYAGHAGSGVWETAYIVNFS